MKPYFETSLGKLYRGNCLEIMPELEPNIDMVLADPPYGMNNNVDSSRFSGGHRNSVLKRGGGGRFNGRILGDDKAFNPEPFLTFKEVILWGYNHFASKLPVGTLLIWIKRFDTAFGTFLSDAEIAWSKGGQGVYCKRDTSIMAEAKNRLHPNQKPIPIIQWCLSRSKTNGVVLDPFLGSGTTAIACERINRCWIGIEISEQYAEIAAKRIERETQQLKLFT